MVYSATALRRRLFTALEAARAGETVQVKYKGIIIHLQPVKPGTKLSRLVRQPVFVPGARKWKSQLRREMGNAIQDDWADLE